MVGLDEAQGVREACVTVTEDSTYLFAIRMLQWLAKGQFCLITTLSVIQGAQGRAANFWSTHNEERRELYFLPVTIRVTKSRRKRWVGRVAHNVEWRKS
jgi:hypothetical protein